MATIRLPNAPASFSISDSFTFTAALLFGPAAGALAVAIDSVVISVQLARRNFKLQRLLFNAAAPALAMWVSARCFFAMVGGGPLIEPTASLGRLTGWVAAQRATIVNSDAVLDLGSVAMALSPMLRSCLSTALFIDDQIVGVADGLLHVN